MKPVQTFRKAHIHKKYKERKGGRKERKMEGREGGKKEGREAQRERKKGEREGRRKKRKSGKKKGRKKSKKEKRENIVLLVVLPKGEKCEPGNQAGKILQNRKHKHSSFADLRTDASQGCCLKAKKENLEKGKDSLLPGAPI